MNELSSAELLRDHAAIDALAAHLTRLLDGAADPDALSLTLDQLVATVADHLALENEMIYAFAMRSQPGTGPEAIAAMRGEYDRLRTQWNEYVFQWTPAMIAEDRPAFERATRAMLPRLRDRVRLENQLLFHLSLQPPGAARAD
jgi:hypothetical protein